MSTVFISLFTLTLVLDISTVNIPIFKVYFIYIYIHVSVRFYMCVCIIPFINDSDCLENTIEQIKAEAEIMPRILKYFEKSSMFCCQVNVMFHDNSLLTLIGLMYQQ